MTRPMLPLQSGPDVMNDPHDKDQRRSNLRLGLLLGAIAVIFFIAIFVKQWVWG